MIFLGLVYPFCTLVAHDLLLWWIIFFFVDDADGTFQIHYIVCIFFFFLAMMQEKENLECNALCCIYSTQKPEIIRKHVSFINKNDEE